MLDKVNEIDLTLFCYLKYNYRYTTRKFCAYTSISCINNTHQQNCVRQPIIPNIPNRQKIAKSTTSQRTEHISPKFARKKARAAENPILHAPINPNFPLINKANRPRHCQLWILSAQRARSLIQRAGKKLTLCAASVAHKNSRGARARESSIELPRLFINEGGARALHFE